MIFQILGLLLTPYGMLAFAVGLLGFFLLPMVPRTLNIFHGLANVHLKLGARMLKRAAVVISEQGDLLLKRMSPNDVGTEEIEFQDDTKEFEDAHRAKSNWMGIPFAFADEAHGVLFSLRDAAVGRREIEAAKNDEVVVKATEQETSMYEVMGWQKAVYELPKDVYELVNLNHIRHLMTGNERAEHPQRVKTYYRNSRKPYEDGTSTVRAILLLVALIGPFGAMFIIWQQVSGSGAGGTTIVGMMGMGVFGALFGSDDDGDDADPLAEGGDGSDDGRDWGAIKSRLAHLAKVSLVVLPLPAVFLALTVFATPTFAISLLVIMSLGFATVPLLVEVLKISDGITHSLSHMLLKLGLSAYREPVWEETAGGYRLREFSQLDAVDEDNIVWHTLLGRKMGFTFNPSPEMWGTELADPAKLEAETIQVTEAAAQNGGDIVYADGGEGQQVSAAKTNIPSGYGIIPEKQRAVYGSMVPSSVERGKYYLWSGIALGRFRNVAIGRKTFKRLEKAKEEFGEDGGMSDKSLIIAMSVLGTISLIAGIVVFFVLIGV
jgi:hypothetical protein